MPRVRHRKPAHERLPVVPESERYAWARDRAALRARMAAVPVSMEIRKAQVDGDVPRLERLLRAAAAAGLTEWPPPARWLDPIGER
jgi:hypothetical protein